MATSLSRKWRARLGMVAVLLAPVLSGAHTDTPEWRAWAPAVFEQAARENRLVLLDLTAQWCTACRRMDETGFRDPRVLETLRRHYLPVRADIEREPEIARRYGVPGVPAVIVLDARGNAIMQRSGYLEPDWLYWMLDALAPPDPPLPKGEGEVSTRHPAGLPSQAAVADDPSPESHR
jgi:hypothetical protein